MHVHITHVHVCSGVTHTTYMCAPHVCIHVRISQMCTRHMHAHTPQCSYATYMLTHSIYVHIDHTCSQVFTHMLTHIHTLTHSIHAHALSGTNCIIRSPALDSGGLPPVPALRPVLTAACSWSRENSAHSKTSEVVRPAVCGHHSRHPPARAQGHLPADLSVE